MTDPRPTLVWFRRDLRLADHPALVQAIARGGPVIPVFLWAPDEEAPWAPGGAARWWLHHSLEALSASLTARGSHLLLRKTDNSLAELRRLVAETGAGTVLWNRLYDPQLIARDKAIKAALRADGLDVESGSGALLFEPPAVKTQSGGPFQVFTPFWKHCLTLGDPPLPLEAPRHLPAPAAWPASQPLSALDLLPRIGWDAAFSQHWTPGESGAWSALERFLEEPVDHYAQQRDRPDILGTSRLSPHLHWGEITARQIWHASQPQVADPGAHGNSARKFIAEVGWREFAHHLLFHFPHTPESPLRTDFEKFPWVQNNKHLESWQRGQTGYPLVDAGMRELWTTGWMHNRVRMVVASFLVKHLRIHWIEGARWFWDTLVDADLASNTLGWQWAAGCGADAAPYFRVFNPILQGEKFDPKGTYIRHWVPELKDVPAKFLNQPWELSPAERQHLASGYPDPIVDHKEARAAALAAFEQITRKRA